MLTKIGEDDVIVLLMIQETKQSCNRSEDAGVTNCVTEKKESHQSEDELEAEALMAETRKTAILMKMKKNFNRKV